MSFEDVLDKVSNGEPIVVCGKVYEPKQFYRFPHLHMFDGLPVFEYVKKMKEEYFEIYEESRKMNCSGERQTDAFILEVMDMAQVCETALRNSGRTEEEMLVLMERHNAKDAERGYDKPGDTL